MSISIFDSGKHAILDFWDALKESGKNFSKLTGVEKAMTIGLTILASLPTLGIGGVFTFMGCSDYFAKRHVKNITHRKGTVDPLNRISEASTRVLPLTQDPTFRNTINNAPLPEANWVPPLTQDPTFRNTINNAPLPEAKWVPPLTQDPTFRNTINNPLPPLFFLPKFRKNDMQEHDVLSVTGGILKGITNVGNSCYLNSTMQALIQNDFFRSQIMNPTWQGIEQVKLETLGAAFGNDALIQDLTWAFKEWDNNLNNHHFDVLLGKYPQAQQFFNDIYRRFYCVKRLQLAMQEFVRQYNASGSSQGLKIHAQNLRNALFEANFFDSENLYGQHDAAELIGKLFNVIGIEKIPLEITRKIPPEITGNIKIEKNEQQPLSIIPITMYPGENLSSQEMVDRFSETFEEITPWRGYDYHQVTYRLGKKPPEQIVLHFKRFVGDFFSSEKIHDSLKVPENHILDLTKAFHGVKAQYRITGAISHGGGYGGGHYWALTRKGNKWYEANDSKISSIKNINPELDNAYILFLEKV